MVDNLCRENGGLACELCNTVLLVTKQMDPNLERFSKKESLRNVWRHTYSNWHKQKLTAHGL